eukprot:gene22604-57328_t
MSSSAVTELRETPPHTHHVVCGVVGELRETKTARNGA